MNHLIPMVLFFFCQFFTLTLSGAPKKKAPTVKVAIEEHIHTHPATTWRLSSTTGFHLFGPNIVSCIKQRFLTIALRKKEITINGIPYPAHKLHIVPRDGHAGIKDKQFHGSFSVRRAGNRTYLINHVDLEEYVYAVLKTESWPGWPVEVNKAFAVSSRSYVLAMIQQQKKPLPYHVKNTNKHQTYHGMHDSTIIRTAVKETKGMILTHKNEPALTMFDSCCGGIIPARIADFDFEKAPYLRRTYACKHCKRCRIYSWEKKLDSEYITKQLMPLLKAPGSLHTIKVAKKDKAGLVTELQIKKGNKWHTLSGNQFYAALKEIKSFSYKVSKKGNEFTVTGIGFGHHRGMCQWGAREMVRDGWNYKRVLSFYYPKTKLQLIA